MTVYKLADLRINSKMSIERELICSTSAKDKYFNKYLFNYFPNSMRDEITVISIKLINQLGGSLINDIKKETTKHGNKILRLIN